MKKAGMLKAASLYSLLSLIMVLVCHGCVTVKLVADYDENIDKGITDLQKRSDAFLLGLKPYSPESEKFYESVRVEISSLRVRADSLQRNSLTVKMLDKLSRNIDRLEADHKSPEGIKKEEVQLYRDGLNSQYTSILTFELAKKRGEAPDETKSLSPPTSQTSK